MPMPPSDSIDNASHPRGRAIAQFMWSFQHIFRFSVKHGVESALREVGFVGDHQVLLVGFQVACEHAFPICIEPEDGPYSPTDLAEVVADGRRRYELHPDRRLMHSDRRLHELRHLDLQDRTRAEALSDALSSTDAGRGYKFFAGLSTCVDDYQVHVVIGLDRDSLESVPCLQTTLRDRLHVTPSLLHGVIFNILDRASRALYLPDAGDSFNVLGARTPEIIRSAAEEFTRSVLLCSGQWFGSEMDLVFNAISALPYEGRPGVGKVIVGDPKSAYIHMVLQLKQPVSLRNTPAVRKLLESTSAHTGILTDGEHVHGLARVNDDYDPTTETIFVVEMTARGSWDLKHADQLLMNVRDGVARLPDAPLNIAMFQDVVGRLLPDANLEILAAIAKAAGQHDHGAMLIISSDASAEAERLSPQAWDTEPAGLTNELTSQLTSMDGGILIDPQGSCHAIGVILDGTARGSGDPSRGSRYNNAVRYLGSNPPPAVVVVYSADGNIDILPKLNFRVSRQIVIDAVEKYVTTALNDPPDLEQAGDLWRRIKKLRFYLSREQCDRLNAARSALDDWRWKNQKMRVSEGGLSPDPRMDDSYWLPEIIG
jgi:hypothetical protein